MKRFIGTVGALFLVAGGLALGAAGPAGGTEDVPHVTICHARNFGNGIDPYIEISPASWGDLMGHTQHDGPVFQIALGAGQPHWGDIIPPFDFPAQGPNPAGHFDGLNWTTAGQAIFDNGCDPGNGTVAVTKDVSGTGIPDSATTYDMTLTCLLDNTTPVTLPDGGEFTLIDGQTTSFEVQAGVTCSVVEGAVSAPNFVNTTNDGPVTLTAVGQTKTITVTNTFAAPGTPPGTPPVVVSPAVVVRSPGFTG